MQNAPQGIFVAQQIAQFAKQGIIRGPKLTALQIQPASLDLRLDKIAYQVRTGFLAEKETVKKKLAAVSLFPIDLQRKGILERGRIYIIPLQESLALRKNIAARTNPKSSTGRLDIFTRVICDHNSRFDDIPSGYHGPIYLEVAPRSFSVQVQTGQSLNQMRFFQGDASIGDEELRKVYQQSPLLYIKQRPLPLTTVKTNREGGFFLHINLLGKGTIGYRAKAYTGIIDVSKISFYRAEDFWEPIYTSNGKLIIEPEQFYIFASKERLRVPPDYAAEMLAYDVGIGELRTNYAGFFDNGFGWNRRGRGTRAVLEVRAHDVPFLIEDGQVFFRLNYFRTMVRPKFLYGDAKARSFYHDQDLTLAKQFQTFKGS